MYDIENLKDRGEYKILESPKNKMLISPNYNYSFDKVNGTFLRRGAYKDGDPEFSEFGPEICDIEITTKCSGVGGVLCPFCYKANNPFGKNMSFETFQHVFHTLPRTVTQIAFGVDSHATENPDIWKIMDYCRTNDYNYVIPNVTVAEIDDDTADKLVNVCGAVAVSKYDDKDICYDSIKKLTDRGLKQCNSHVMISEETFESAMEILMDYNHDPRLKDMNAVVFLSLKKKGRGTGFHRLSDYKFKRLITYAFAADIPIGFDSCSCVRFLENIQDHPQYEQIKVLTEPCESSRFSAYINVDGKYSPCSFIEGTGNWHDGGMSVIDGCDFIKDIWNCESNKNFRETCISCLDEGMGCQYYEV